jgi:hypothetical protein
MPLLLSLHTHAHSHERTPSPERYATVPCERRAQAPGGISEVKGSVHSAHPGRDSHHGRHELCHVQPGPQPAGRRYVTALSRAQRALTPPLGTSNGYRVYTTDPFNKQSESREGDVSSLEMLFSTSLAALTLSPRVLRIQNTKVRRRGS